MYKLDSILWKREFRIYSKSIVLIFIRPQTPFIHECHSFLLCLSWNEKSRYQENEHNLLNMKETN